MAYLRDVLALQLRQELRQALIVRLNADGGQDLGDLLLGGGSSAGQGQQEVGSEELHCDGLNCACWLEYLFIYQVGWRDMVCISFVGRIDGIVLCASWWCLVICSLSSRYYRWREWTQVTRRAKIGGGGGGGVVVVVVVVVGCRKAHREPQKLQAKKYQSVLPSIGIATKDSLYVKDTRGQSI